MTSVGGISGQHQQELWKGAGIGGLIGAILNRPILGALGGMVYKLFTTEGLAQSASKIVGDVTGSQDPVGSLGKMFGLGPKPEGATAGGTTGAQTEPPKSAGIPGWAKALGIGALALTAVNFIQDNVANTFMGTPYGIGGIGGGGLLSNLVGGIFGGPWQAYGQPYYGGYGFGYPIF